MSEQIDWNDPRRILEAKEEHELDKHGESDIAELSDALVRIISWLIEGKSPADVGYRVYIVCYVIYPALIAGMNLETIAEQMGHGRSDANRLTNQFSDLFGVRGINQKSEEHRKQQSERWHKSHGINNT